MNDIETHSPAQGSGMELQIAALQQQVFLLLLALIVTTATIVFYLYYQTHIVNSDLNTYRPRAVEAIQMYNQNALTIDSLDKQFISYGSTHPTFQPILMKYGLIAPPPAATAPKQ